MKNIIKKLFMDILKQNVDITNLSNFKTKAEAKYFYEIESEDNVKILKNIFDFASKNSLKMIFI